MSSTMKFVILLVGVVCFTSAKKITERKIVEQDSKYWQNDAQKYLDEVLKFKPNVGKAKNVIFFLGDGMGVSTVTAGRIFAGQQKGYMGEDYKLFFEKFPSVGLSKTYSADTQVTDSAAGANALFSGVKTRSHMIGLDARAPYKKCDPKTYNASKLESLVVLAQNSGLDTGLVTTCRVTHATPSTLYAHSNSRQWECDSDIPRKYKNCPKDIARQLVEDKTGQNLKVIMGGGDQCLCNNEKICQRKDKIRPAAIWKKNNPNGKFVTSKTELMNVDIASTDKIMGIFHKSHMEYKANNASNAPTLAEMTSQAIKMLKKNKNGFFLMVEGGRIDLAHHGDRADLAMVEVAEFEKAVETAAGMVNLEETLIVVTADHSHGLTINGYPDRGADILSRSKEGYDTLTYAVGPIYKKSTGKLPRFAAGINNKRAVHGGEDVALFATGPWAHLLNGNFEENYVQHVVKYAACYKGARSHCKD